MAPNSSLWLDLLGCEVRFRSVAGYTTRSIESGAGEPVVLVHGLLGHVECWASTVQPLASQGFRVSALDLLGHGLTAKPDIDYSIRVLAEHVVAFLDAIGVRRAHVVGHSLGGWVACWLAVHRPERVASFVSVVGAGIEPGRRNAAPPLPLPLPLPGPSIADLNRRAIAEPNVENVRAPMTWSTREPSAVSAELVDTRVRLFDRSDFRAVGPGLLDAFVGPQRSDEFISADQLARVTCPALFVWTGHNPKVSHEASQTASEIVPGGRFHLIQDAGHTPQLETSAELNAVLADFLRSVASPVA